MPAMQKKEQFRSEESMATLHLMVGLPGSGKTTAAIRLEKEYRALRLTTDEWHYRLFGNDFHNDGKDVEHDRRHAAIEALMRETARRVLTLGGMSSWILDAGQKRNENSFGRKPIPWAQNLKSIISPAHRRNSGDVCWNETRQWEDKLFFLLQKKI